MEKYKKELEQLKEQSRFRQVASIEKKDKKFIFLGKKKYLNLSSNDYLGIANDKKLIKEFLNEFEQNEDLLLSSASARLLTGNSKIFAELENWLAQAYKKEDCLLFNSGYHANIGTISALCQKGCAVFSDKLNHASIIDGMKLAQGDFYRYKHLDYEHLETLLEKRQNDYEQLIIASESVFSMDGDLTDIQKLVEIKNKYNAILIIDEAHAFGVFGEIGLGLSESHPEVDLVVATFGKAIGSYGAFVTGKKILIDYIKNKARSFIFSTTIPPICALWTKWVLENKLPKLKENRQNLLELSGILRSEFETKGITTIGNSQIVPIVIGSDDDTVKIAQKLQSQGYWVLPIRPPTVAPGKSRLRLSLTASMTWKDIKNIPEIIQKELL